MNSKRTNYRYRCVLIGLIVSMTMPEIYADVEAGGSLRARYEAKKQFDLDSGHQDYTLSQIRAYISFDLSPKTKFLAEIQDARVHGEDINGIPSINENAKHQPFSDPLDMHRFHITHKADGWKVKLGRQKFNLGDKRLVASLEWVNTARVHDAVRVTYDKNEKRTIDVFASKLVGIDPDNWNDQQIEGNRYFDSSFHGVYVSDKSLFENSTLQYWWFLRQNDEQGVNMEDSINTLGVRFLTKIMGWNTEFQTAVQNGDWSGMEHSGYMLRFGIDKNVGKANIAFGYNHASGDDDPTDDKHKTFDNLYPLNHAYYGFMDLFSLQNIHNLEAIYKRKVFDDKVGMRLALQTFWLDTINDAWYNAGLRGNSARRSVAESNNADSFVGSEIDILFKKKIKKPNVALMLGYSRFFSGSYAEDTQSSKGGGGGSEDADFFYFQVLKKF